MILSWNGGAERMFGYTAEEIRGQPGGRIVRDDRHGELVRMLETARQGRQVLQPQPIIGVRKDRSEIAVGLRISPLVGKDGTIAVIAVGREL